MDKGKILVAEDDAFLREVYQETLTRGGYNVVVAVDGEDALNKIKIPGWQLVLLDIVMPKMDGISVLKKAKEDPTFDTANSLRVVFLTNLDNESEIKEASQLGMGYLIKSQMTPADLLTEVHKFITPQPAAL